MTPPRWSTAYATEVRDALVGMVEDESRAVTRPGAARRAPGRLRLAVATAVVLALVVPATVLAFTAGSRMPIAAGRGTLAVATHRSDDGAAGDPVPSGIGSTEVGILTATSSGATACFTLTPIGGAGTAPMHLVFPSGWRATGSLALLDAGGAVVARSGETVRATVATLLLPGAAGCGAGPGATVLALTRNAVDLGVQVGRTPLPESTRTSRPSAHGCTATTATTPAGARTAPIADVDGDGRRDTEWASLLPGGTIRFGITTASGATVSGEQGFAGGGDRTFVVGRLADGVVVAITSEGRDSPVFTFAGCAFQPLRGRDLLPGTSATSPFTLYSEDGGGDGGCFDGRLALTRLRPAGADSVDVVARWVDVSADGRRATLTGGTTTIARGVAVDGGRSAAFKRYVTVSCGASPVLRPVVR